MTSRKSLCLSLSVLAFALLVIPARAQGARGKASLSVGSGSITVDYGRPSTKGPSIQGREPLDVQQAGSVWRMGTNASTTFTTPVDLTFGGTKIAKGSYSLWLVKESDEAFKLVFNSQTGQWGTEHDKSKDVAEVSMKRAKTPAPVELFTIDLKKAPKGGAIVLSWGNAELTADFQTAG